MGVAYACEHRCEVLTDRRIQLLRGDQSKREDRERIAGSGPFDIVIDDGSHVPEHQIATFKTLWPALRGGGLYAVEDIETSYWRRGVKMYNQAVAGSVVSYFEHLIHTAVNGEYAENRSTFAGDIESMEFAPNLILIRKFHSRKNVRRYRFQKKLAWMPAPPNQV